MNSKTYHVSHIVRAFEIELINYFKIYPNGIPKVYIQIVHDSFNFDDWLAERLENLKIKEDERKIVVYEANARVRLDLPIKKRTSERKFNQFSSNRSVERQAAMEHKTKFKTIIKEEVEILKFDETMKAKLVIENNDVIKNVTSIYNNKVSCNFSGFTTDEKINNGIIHVSSPVDFSDLSPKQLNETFNEIKNIVNDPNEKGKELNIDVVTKSIVKIDQLEKEKLKLENEIDRLSKLVEEQKVMINKLSKTNTEVVDLMNHYQSGYMNSLSKLMKYETNNSESKMNDAIQVVRLTESAGNVMGSDQYRYTDDYEEPDEEVDDFD
jgi:hypothetical protein